MLGIGLGLSNAAALGGGGGGPAWDPNDNLTLFAQYEPWDATTLIYSGEFKEIRPAATSDADLIGFFPDKSQFANHDTWANLMASVTEISEDPDFDTPGDWTATNCTVTGGGVVFTGVAGANVESAGSLITEATGAWYCFELNITAYTAGDLLIAMSNKSGDAISSATSNITTTGIHHIWMRNVFHASNQTFEIRSGTTAFNGTIGSCSVKYVPGNHLTLTTAADRPTRQTTGGVTCLNYDSDEMFTTADVTIPTAGVSALFVTHPKVAGQALYAAAGSLSTPDTFQFGTTAGNWVQTLHTPGTTQQWTDTDGDTTDEFHIWELEVDWNSTDAYEIWKDGSSVDSGTLSASTDLSGTTNRIRMGASGSGNNEVDDTDIFAMYWYQDARSSALYTHADNNTGNQIV